MTNLSFRDFLGFADVLREQAANCENLGRSLPYIIGSILNSWMALESFVNNMLFDFASLPASGFTVHERGFLEERQVRFSVSGSDAGTFKLEAAPEYRRLEDKVLFLTAKFGKNKLDKGTALWQRFEKIKKKRNVLSHLRRGDDLVLSVADCDEAASVTKDLITMLSKEVWKKPVKW